MITPENLVRHELVGLFVKITKSTDPSNVGIEGRIVDETRNTLTIETKKGKKSFIKEKCTFSFLLPTNERVNVDGRVLVARPEDRIKKKFKKW
ncbi:MAG: ribonuclease P protein component 1 [Candidatus Aenigmatarchaeota archaeon]|nr:MAG: ribonuclease P protein component 1 [Candidatus Aenigmarchaeota archaeon]